MCEAPPEQQLQRPSVVVITGPTAAGKTALALDLAERFGAEIVGADSMQVYRFLDIGTAKPTRDERARIPHHLIDIVPPTVQYNAARFAEDAARAAHDVWARGRRVFLVGGTGLYIRAFLEGGMAGVARNAEVRQGLLEEAKRCAAAGDPGALHRRLERLDPETAGGLHPHDRMRIVRALEIYAVSGEIPSALRRARRSAGSRYRSLHLALDPGEGLALRIRRRCEGMIAAGLLQEVRALRDRGFGPELPCMRAIGYRHMQPVLEGRETLAHVAEEMNRDTWQFARRQRTWLRGVPDARWLDPADPRQITEAVARFLHPEGGGTY